MMTKCLFQGVREILHLQYLSLLKDLIGPVEFSSVLVKNDSCSQYSVHFEQLTHSNGNLEHFLSQISPMCSLLECSDFIYMIM